MTKQTPVTAETGITAFPLASLYLSEMNPRQDADAEGIDLLADSIAICGLIQNLAGIEDGKGKVAIVAGGRRLRAIARAFERDPDLLTKRPELATIPVRLARDEAEARAWASAENSARQDLAPADEIRAYGRMKEAGAEVATIAQTFGTTEARVYRFLALASLPAPVLDALKLGQITTGVARAFTVANDESLALDVLRQVIEADYPVSEHRVRAMLQPEAVSLKDRRAQFVGLEAYEAAGGKLTRDLFEDSAYLQNPDLLDRLVAERLEAEAAKIEAQGWKWVETHEEPYLSYERTSKMQRLYPVEGELTEDQTERYDELAELANGDCLDDAGREELDALQDILDGDFTEEQRQHSGVFVMVNSAGDLTVTAPYVRPEDFTAAIEAEVLTDHAAKAAASEKEGAPKSPYSAALATDMHRARLHAVQAALLSKPELMLDLLTFALSGLGGRYETVLGIRADKANITPDKPEGLAAAEGLADPEDNSGSGWMDEAAQVEAWDKFRALTKKERNAILTRELARTVTYPHSKTALFDRIEDMAGADMRQHWTPTAEGFFSRVSADYLDALLLDLTGCDPTCNGFKAFKASKKAEKADMLERLFTDPQCQRAWQVDAEHLARIEKWKPNCL